MQPRQSIESEKAVLGACFVDNDAIPAAAEVLQPEHFYDSKHAQIFGAILGLSAKNKPVDFTSVAQVLNSHLEDVGGVEAIISLIDAVPSAANIMHYVEVVRNAAQVREIQAEARRIVNLCGNENKTVSEIQEAFESAAFSLSATSRRRKVRPFNKVLNDTLIKINEKQTGGLLTGFVGIDNKTGGFRPGELIIICGRPRMGKTSFALDVAMFVAETAPVIIFSLEMAEEDLTFRALASAAGVNLMRIRNRDLTSWDHERIWNTAGPLSEKRLFIDDSDSITVSSIRSKARHIMTQLKAEQGLIIIDYAQLITPERMKDNREQQVAAISRGLKQVARSLRVPVLLLCQLNREVEKRDIANDKRRPQLQDLRESGSLEQDADMVIALYRRGVYMADEENHGEAVVLKHRNGPTGIVKLHWEPEFTRFENPDA